MKYVCYLLLLAFSLVLVLPLHARAQISPYSAPQGNVGSWSWDKPSARHADDSEDREPGETSWERMQAERAPVAKEYPRQEVLKSLSPLRVWRWWRGEKKTDSVDSTAEEPHSNSTEKEILDDSQEPPPEEE